MVKTIIEMYSVCVCVCVCVMLLFFYLIQIQHAMIQISDWLMAPAQMKVESSFVVKEWGELCAVTDGIGEMQWWCVDS